MTNVKQTSPLKWVPTLYFAMGMPFVIVNMVCVLMYKGLGVSDSQIAFWTSLIILPWTLKPLWSPLLEIYRTKKFFVITTQILTGVVFGLIALALHLPSFFAVSIALLFVIALSASTHDIAADGLYMQELDNETQALYIGWQGAFYNLAKIVATGGLVYFAGWLIEYYSVGTSASQVDYVEVTRKASVAAWTVIMFICAAIMALLGLYHIKSIPRPVSVDKKPKSFRETKREMLEVFSEFFCKKHVWWYIVFILLYRFAEGFVMKIVPLFLKASRESQGLGLTEQQIGICYGTFGAAAFILGSILGGYYIARMGLRRSLFTLCCVFNLPFAAYTLLAVYQPESLMLIGGGIVLEYFGYGFGFVGLTLFMMQQVAPGRHRMAHYAFASGIMNLGVMIPGMMSGVVSDWLGYKMFFVFVLFATIPAFLATWFVPFSYDSEGNKIENTKKPEDSIARK